MPTLSAFDILDLWESGTGYRPLDQGLLILRHAFPDLPFEALADWPLGRCNRALAELRSEWFGSSLEGWTSCVRCREKLEFELDCRNLIEEASTGGSEGEPIVVGEHSFRVPTSRDVARLADEKDLSLAALQLVERCQLSPGTVPSWTEKDVDEVGSALAAADPMAETRLEFRCPACGLLWDEALNFAAFLWAEIEVYAVRLLHDAHTLASAYGWSEREILSLSDLRRSRYVEMVRG